MNNMNEDAIQNQMRINRYSTISTEIALLSDRQLISLLEHAEPNDKTIGGDTALLMMNGTNIFIKKILLTDLERKPENIMSTANLFELPLYYQYGVGSTGFGAWRELAVHTMTTNWVLCGECPHFPLMYHYRVLPRKVQVSEEEMKAIDLDVDYWGGSSAIRDRLNARLTASAEIVLFLEYIPENLYQWLSQTIVNDSEVAGRACAMVDSQLKKINGFMNAHGLLHLDAHFENILTDGNQLYFTDFGLALSALFELTSSEIAFFQTHKTYDQYSTMTNLLYCIVTSLYGKNNWIDKLDECISGIKGQLPNDIYLLINRYEKIAHVMNEFYCKLQRESKLTPYPHSLLDTVYSESF